ncbi:fibronectin type III domain-containing protein [Leadbettera azotonutricia]|uniref:Sperm-activating peptides family n=1 Tax=Leadbettera azotonutricia (strain ATCC BAA-888 / DSM 13862 / ZAS-9) TaxID=545695 RepID=F5Y9A8_LEAAZ|nr:fibronectin type III domain-containing protein [Leadbettera azotonutricia]AEF81949.1 sperm-activating peptides family [Leadbettera azotonutricia ZAS-9]
MKKGLFLAGKNMKTACKFLLSILLLLCLAGCENPFTQKPFVPESSSQGYVAVHFETPQEVYGENTGEGGERTLYPELPAFTKYELSFSNGPEARPPFTVQPGSNTVIELAVGSWTITAIAYSGSEGSYTEAARGSASPVTISAGNTSVADISLTPSAGGIGFFNYTVNLPSGAAGNIVITNPEGGMVNGGNITLNNSAVNGTLNLLSGQYIMSLILTLNGKRSGRTEILHVYPNLTSRAAYTFSEFDFRAVMGLTHNAWASRTLANPGDTQWYTFNAEAGKTYQIQWNDAYEGDASKSLDIKVSAVRGNGAAIFANRDSGWNSPKTISGFSGSVYIAVQGKSNSSTGTYALKYYDTVTVVPQGIMAISSVNTSLIPAAIISWNSVEEISAYRLYRALLGGGPYTQIADQRSTVFTDEDVVGNITYYYKAAAYNANGEGDASPAASGTIPASHPAAITALANNAWTGGTIGAAGAVGWYKFTAESARTYYIQWNDAVQGDASKSLDIKVSAYSAAGDVLFENEDSAWTVPKIISGLRGTVFLKAAARNNSSTGTYSIRQHDPLSVIPEVPENVSAGSGNGQITVNWNGVLDAVEYEVYCGEGTAIPSAPSAVTGNTSAVISGLSNGINYSIWVKAKNLVGLSGASARVSVKPIAGMGEVTVSSGNEQLNLSWAAVAGADEYEVYYGTGTTIPGTPAQTVSTTSASITGLVNGTSYNIWVKGKNSTGKGGASAMASGKPLGTPGTLTVNEGIGELTISWATVPGADEYEVYYGTETPTNLWNIVSSTTTTITGLTNGTLYNVRLRSKNATGVSDWSNVATGKPIGTMGSVTVSSEDGKLNLSWAAIAGADEYEVYYGTGTAIPGTPAQTVSTTSASITGLVNGTSYNIWVKGKNSTGKGGASAMASGKPLGTPGTLTVNEGIGELTISWATVPGADEYEVYYGTETPTNLWNTVSGTTATIPLANGISYTMRIRARNATGSVFSPIATGTPAIRPGLFDGTIDRAFYIGPHTITSSASYLSASAVNGHDYLIITGEDESLAPLALSYPGKTIGIALMGLGAERTISLNANGSMFTVSQGVTLALKDNLILAGLTTNDSPLVRINTNGSFTMEGGTISGNSSSYSGGGVYSSGSFTMKGGTISGNSSSFSSSSSSYGGGSVYVSSNGSFTMKGGTISGNSSSHGGGVYVTSNGSFTMEGGTISGNSSSYEGGGVYVTSDGSFTMGGGTISGNSSSSYGGGGVYIYSNGSFTLKGGTIRENTASSRGGGVYVYSSGSFTMEGGTISGNSSSYEGGGVCVSSDGSFTKSGTSIIYGDTDTTHTAGANENTALSGQGHAIYWYASPSKQRQSTLGANVDLSTNTADAGYANWD